MDGEFKKGLVDFLLNAKNDSKETDKKEENGEELLEEDGFIYYIMDNDSLDLSGCCLDDDEHIASIVDYCGPDMPILVLPEKIGGNYVATNYNPDTMKTPENVKYLVLEQPSRVDSLCFLKSNIEGIIILKEHDPDNPDEAAEWKKYTKEFIKTRECKLYDNFTPDDMEAHFEIERKILTDFFKKFAQNGTEEDMKYLLSKGMTIGDIYMEAIVGDDVDTIKRLERLGFPGYAEFEDSEDDFIKKIPDEVRYFRARKVEEYFGECG